ncbi:MAG: hypothetical protein K9G13_03730 [Aquiluna sp.]|nr:hypothetical protein [Aquiluna sp.]MCF8545630.1 hypothetical protein [Aquiluna sp.]
MEIFLGLVAIWAIFSVKAKKQKHKEDEIYHRAITDAQQELAHEQAAYNQMTQSLPTIYGPGTFTIRVNTNSADPGVINNYTEYLEREFTKDTEFMAILEHQPNRSNKHAIRVEVSTATMGYLYLENNQEICEELDKVGGRATCEAKLVKEKITGMYDLFIDLDFPLLIGEPKA